MKILIINSVCGTGSTGRICTDLYDVLKTEGHECCIAYGRGETSKEYQTYKIGNSLDNYWHVLETRLFDNHGFASRLATKKFITFVKDYNPDVIHMHNIHGYYLNIKILFKYLKNYEGKVIWTLHDEWAFSDHEAYIYEDQSDKKRIKEYPMSYIHFKNNKKIKKNIFSGLKDCTIVCPSNWIAENVERSFLSYPVEVINNGIDLSIFQPNRLGAQILRKKRGLLKKRILLGCASIWDTRKGLSFLENLADNLSKEYQIVVIGKTDKQQSSKIMYIDHTESVNELTSWYSTADFLLNPTLNDNFPTVNLEALACGTPVITFDTGGSPETIDENCGAVLKEKNAAEIKRFLESGMTFNTEDCISRAKKFNKNNKFLEYLDLYKKI